MARAHTQHHTVPAGYLCGFATKVKTRPKLVVLDLERREWRVRQSPKEVCKHNRFYAVDVPGVPENVVETDVLQKLETGALPLIRGLDRELRQYASVGGRTRQPQIRPDDLDLLAAFTAIMWVRTEAIRALGRKAVGVLIPEVMKRLYPTPEAFEIGLAKARSAGRDVGGLTFEQWNRLMTGDSGVFDFTKDFYVWTMLGAWKTIYQVLVRRPASFQVARGRAGLLVASDAPVSVYKQGDGEVGLYRSDMRDPTTSVQFPLTAHVVICFDETLEPSIGLMEREKVAMVNTATALPDASLVLSATRGYQWWDGHSLRESWDLVEASETWRQAADKAEMEQLRNTVAGVVENMQPRS